MNHCKRTTQSILNQHQSKLNTLSSHFQSNHQLQNAINSIKLAKSSSNYPWKPPFESANIFITHQLPKSISEFSKSSKIITPIGPLKSNQLSFQELISLELDLYKLEQKSDPTRLSPTHRLQIILSSWQLLHHYLGICDSLGQPNLISINQAIRRFLKPIHLHLASISHHQFNSFPSQSHSPTRISNYLHNYLQHYAILYDRHHFNLQSLNLNRSILVQYLLIALEINHKPLNHQLLKALETPNLSFDLKTYIHLWKVLLNTSPYPSSPLLDWFIHHLPSHPSLHQKSNRTISRLFASSLGILLNTLRNSFRKQQITDQDFYHRLTEMLNTIRSSSIKSPEISHRRIQILCLLPESNQLSTEDLQYDDPYLMSTLFRTCKIDEIESVLKSTNQQVDHQEDQRRSLDLMRVIARSQGYLVHKNRIDQQVSLMSSSIETSEVDDPGLVLSLSQVLVEKLKLASEDEGASDEQMIQDLDQLLALSMSSSDTLHGGVVEKNRLDHRKSQGLRIYIHYILSKPESKSGFPKVLRVLETCDPKLLQPNLLKHIITYHLKFSNDYPTHLKLLEVLKPCSIHLSFKSIFPNDLSLLILNKTFQNLSSFQPTSACFLEIQTRLQDFCYFLNAFGYPIRRFRGQKLLRLVFLSLRRVSVELDSGQWNRLERLVKRIQENQLIGTLQTEEEIKQKSIEEELQKGFEMYKEQSLVYALATLLSDKLSGWFKVHEKERIGLQEAAEEEGEGEGEEGEEGEGREVEGRVVVSSEKVK